jgi:hypothetical protein
MVLVGAIVAVLALSAASLRGPRGSAALTRLAFRVLLARAARLRRHARRAEWVASEPSGRADLDRIGYATSDGGLLLIVIATVLAWRGRAGRRGPGRWAPPGRPLGAAPARPYRHDLGDDDEAGLSPSRSGLSPLGLG